MPIEIADYDPRWPRQFAALRDRIWPSISHLALRIDHVGSTSVPGLAGKPLIDLDVVLPDAGQVAETIAALAPLDYAWLGDLQIPGREALRYQGTLALPAHNLYVVVENNKAHLDHWLFRDLLRTDPAVRDAYAALKRANALVAKDMDEYVELKAAFVTEQLARAREALG